MILFKIALYLSKFLFKANIENEDYHPLDVERIKKDTHWIRAFYKHNQENPVKTCNAIHDVLLWRKEFDANS